MRDQPGSRGARSGSNRGPMATALRSSSPSTGTCCRRMCAQRTCPQKTRSRMARVAWPRSAALALGLVSALATSRAWASPEPQAVDDPWFGADKAMHFAASGILAGVGYGASSWLVEERLGRAAIGAAVGLGAGIAKELYDLAGYGHPSWRDLAWDAIGTAAGVLVGWLVDLTVSALWDAAQQRPAPSSSPAPSAAIWGRG